MPPALPHPHGGHAGCDPELWVSCQLPAQARQPSACVRLRLLPCQVLMAPVIQLYAKTYIVWRRLRLPHEMWMEAWHALQLQEVRHANRGPISLVHESIPARN